MRHGLKTLTMVAALVVIWGVFQYATDGAFLQVRNLSNLFRQMSLTGILAASMTLVLVAGHVDLSIGSVVAFLGAVLAIANAEWGLSPAAAVGLSLVVGVGIGVFQGWLTASQRIPAFIVTLGGMLVFRGASMWITHGNTIALPDNWLTWVGSGYVPASVGWAIGAFVMAWAVWRAFRSRRLATVIVLVPVTVGFLTVCTLYEGVPFPVFLMIALMGVFTLLTERTPFGRHVFAVGGSLEAARLSGVPVVRTVIGVFALMGALGGIGALVLTSRVGSASPDAGGLLELDAIAACVIGGTSLMGGRGSVFGAILGALMMESLNNGMSLANMESFWQYILKGAVLVAAVWADSASQGKKT
jgi:D-xylose transport system permease protein